LAIKGDKFCKIIIETIGGFQQPNIVKYLFAARLPIFFIPEEGDKKRFPAKQAQPPGSNSFFNTLGKPCTKEITH
jgi:hypothetical protein